MKKIQNLALTLGFIGLFSACATSHLSTEKSSTPAPWPVKTADEVSLMSFNVENLFDNIHDENRDDQTFLPLAAKQTAEHKALCAALPQISYRKQCQNLDWSDEVVNAKLKNIAQIILGVDGTGPDILILEEVENDRILTRLNKEFLAAAGYQTQVLIEGPDTRGIDIAVLSRLPLDGKSELHKIPFEAKEDHDKEGMARSRGILEVPLKMPHGEKVLVFGVHFPSQENPRYWREQAVEYLAKLIEDNAAKGMVLAGGDFNISHNEEINERFFRNQLSDVAYVSHVVGCKKCAGTHAYRKEWSFFDALLFSKNLGAKGNAPYLLETDSIDVVRHDAIHIEEGKYPRRFDPEKREGVSDHFPIYARLRLRK